MGGGERRSGQGWVMRDEMIERREEEQGGRENERGMGMRDENEE